MKRLTAVVTLVSAVLYSAILLAQGHPDFSGTWTLDASKSVTASGGRMGASGSVTDANIVKSAASLDQVAIDAVRQWQGTPTLLNNVPVPIIMTATVMSPRLTITQDAMSLTVARDTSASPLATVYRFDGQDSRNAPAAPNAEGFVYRSHWDGAKLVTMIISTGTSGPLPRTETRYLDGESMVVETTRPSPQGGATVVQKQVFNRVPKGAAAAMFSVIGAVENPGEFAWVAGMTVRQTLAKAGGFSSDGEGTPDMRDVVVFHSASSKALIFNRNIPPDTLVLPDDEISVAHPKRH